MRPGAQRQVEGRSPHSLGCHSIPSLLSSLLAFCSLVFSKRALKPDTPLGPAHAAPPAGTSSSTPPLGSSASSGSPPGPPGRGCHVCSAFLQPLCTGASLFFYNFHHCVLKTGCMGPTSSDQHKKWLEGAGRGGAGNSARRLMQSQVPAWTMMGQWRWRHREKVLDLLKNKQGVGAPAVVQRDQQRLGNAGTRV